MSFSDYSGTPAENTAIGDTIYIGPNMERGKVRPALQQLAADGRELYDEMIARNGGSDLPNFVQAGTGSVASTVNAKLRRIQVDIEDFGGGVDVSDNTDAMLKAIAALDDAGGGTLTFGAGIYNFASLPLQTAGGLELPSNVTITGKGKGTTRLEVTGTTSCYFFTNILGASNHLICEMTLRGNSVAAGNGPGGVYFCSLHPEDASANVTNCVLRDVVLENWGGDAWAWWYNTHPDYTISCCGLIRVDVVTEEGNARAPSNLGVPSYIVEFLGKDDGLIHDCFVDEMSADLDWVKGAVVVFGNVYRTRIAKANLRNAFQGYALADKGGYALLLYDQFGIVTDTLVDSPVITNPFSCGIYNAGTRNTQFIAPRGSGQEDTADGTLPKAMIALNGPNGVTITNPDLSDNAIALAIAGVSPDVASTMYPSDMNVVVTGGSMRNSSFAGMILTSSAWRKQSGGVRIVGTKVSSSVTGVSGMLWRINTSANDPDATPPLVNAPSGFVDFEWIGGECSGGSGGFDVNLNATTNTSNPSGKIRFNGVRFSGDTVTVSFKAIGVDGGALELTGCKFEGTGAYHLQIENQQNLHLRDLSFSGAVSGGQHALLSGCQGTARDLRSATGTQIVDGTGMTRALPTWAGYPGAYVENTIPGLTGTTPTAYRLRGWGWVTGTTWSEDRSGLV